MIINIKDLKNKIIYRANYRGTKEMDKLLGSFAKIYINQLKERYGHLNPFYDEKNYALAGVIAKLSQNRFLKDFDLVNASPSYIRNKVADTIIERRERQ